jgi:SAM-dependent methyltransferase
MTIRTIRTHPRALLVNLKALASGKNLHGRLQEAQAATAAARERERAAETEYQKCKRVIEALIDRHYSGRPLPPPDLRLHVGMTDSAANWWAQGIDSSTRVLEVFGVSPSYPILDWGCGTGRTALWLQAYEAYRTHYHGCDVDADAIRWLREHGEPNVEVCQDSPPLPYPDARFGGLFAFSVLTHIRPERHRDWYVELRRVLRPGGIAYVTTHGAFIIKQFDAALPEPAKAEFSRTGHTYVEHEGHYKDASIVSEEFTRKAMDGLFVVESYRDAGYHNQDAYLLRRKD